MAKTMRAMGATGNSVKMIEIPKPTPGRGEVRVKVIASAVNPGEEKVMSGDFVGRFLHAKTSPLVLGWDFAGTVDVLGDGVTDINEGAAVWGHLAYSMSQKQGAFAEYITLPREALAVKPEDVPYQVAAAAATVSMTGLQSLHVTGVCSSKDVERVKALGADAVIDRKKADPLDAESAYDVVFDTPAVHSFGRCVKVLRTGGSYVTTLPGGTLVTGMARALFTSKHCRFVQVASKRADLELVGGWLVDGLEVTIDSRHKIADLGTALKRQTDSGRVGRVVVDIAEGWPS
jgi:NADPH:quinone reductase-like Zn-dependent oxidoreductase